MSTDDAIAIYRLERDRAKARLAAAKKVEMATVTKAWKAHLKREELAGRGGRPKGSKPRSIEIPRSKRGRPVMPQVQRESVPDLASQLSPYYGSDRRSA